MAFAPNVGSTTAKSNRMNDLSAQERRYLRNHVYFRLHYKDIYNIFIHIYTLYITVGSYICVCIGLYDAEFLLKRVHTQVIQQQNNCQSRRPFTITFTTAKSIVSLTLNAGNQTPNAGINRCHWVQRSRGFLDVRNETEKRTNAQKK